MGGIRRRSTALMVATLMIGVTGCGGGSGSDGSSTTKPTSERAATTTTAAPKALPSDPCDMLKDDEVAEIMGWPDYAGVEGEPPSSAFGGDEGGPACTWTYADYVASPPEVSTLNLSTGAWSTVKEDFDSPRARMETTEDDRILVVTYDDMDPVALVHLGDQAVMVTILDDTQPADPVDVSKQLLETYA